MNKKLNRALDQSIDIKVPQKSDGVAMWELAKKTEVLDLNSSYSYNLIASHFNQTSALAVCNHIPIGFVSAYFIPEFPTNLFIWQVGVHPSYQGKGVAFKMIQSILKRDVCQKVTFLKTTISPSNIPSKKLFQNVASYLSSKLECSEFYIESDFPGIHEQEDLITIGPIKKH